MPPTPEQIAAAKAWNNGEETKEQVMILRTYAAHSIVGNVVSILHSALEAAEPLAEIGRLAVERYRANIAKTDTIDDWRRADVEMSMMCGVYVAKNPKP